MYLMMMLGLLYQKKPTTNKHKKPPNKQTNRKQNKNKTKQNTELKSEFRLSCSVICPWASHHTPFPYALISLFLQRRSNA